MRCRAVGGMQGLAKGMIRRYGTTVFTKLEAMDRAKERLCICDNCYYPFFGSRREDDVCRPLWLPDYGAFLTLCSGQTCDDRGNAKC